TFSEESRDLNLYFQKLCDIHGERIFENVYVPFDFDAQFPFPGQLLITHYLSIDREGIFIYNLTKLHAPVRLFTRDQMKSIVGSRTIPKLKESLDHRIFKMERDIASWRNLLRDIKVEREENEKTSKEGHS